MTLSQPLNVPVTLNYYTADGSAIAGSQYTATTGFLTIGAGATSGKVTVTIVASRATVSTAYRLILTSATDGLVVARGTGTGTILPRIDGNPPLLSVGDAVVPTGSGPTSAGFTVTLSHPSSSDVTAVVVPVNGTATGGVDYTANAVSLTIPSGSVSARISIPVSTWSGGTCSRQFAVHLRLRNGSAHLGRTDGQGTLLPPPVSA